MRLNLSEALYTWAERYPEKIAVSGDFNVSYGQLNEMSNAVANSIISEIGNAPTRIALLISNPALYIAALIGIIRSGNVYVLINYLDNTERINLCLHNSNCEYYLSDYVNENIVGSVIHVSFTAKDKTCSFSRDTGLTEDCGIFFSSGTTGIPKAIKRNSYSVLSEVIQWIIELQLINGSCFFIPRPLFYTGGFILMYATLFAGGNVAILKDISTEAVIDFISKNKDIFDWALIVPKTIRDLLHSEYSGYVSNNVLTMGETILHSEKMNFHNKFKCNIIEVWGNSEGLGTITLKDDLITHPGSIGRPFFTDYLNIDTESHTYSGSIVEEGILFGKSDNEFSEYIGDPEKTGKILKKGYIYSEDIGYKDKDGYFYLRGRINHRMCIGDKNIFSSRLESFIFDQYHLRDVALIEKNGKCYIILTTDIDINPDIIVAAICEKFELSSDFVEYKIVDSIPRNFGGKTDIERLNLLLNDETRT